MLIARDPGDARTYSIKGNTVAVVSDGSAIPGQGNIGGLAALPVMEGMSLMFKEFGGVDAFPLCVRSKDVDEIVRTVYLLSGSFGGINLEDIAAPRCFEIERRLKEVCDIPIFHDDQHGTAVVTAAALRNALRIVKKTIGGIRIVISGAGAAGISVAKLLMDMGAADLLLAGRRGILCEGMDALNEAQRDIAKVTNRGLLRGSLQDAMAGADVFIGVSAPGIVTREMVASMKKDAIVLAMANPVPEIFPEEALQGGAAVVGTGRSDFPNQINNVLAFPGIFRGALDVRASDINGAMKLAAAEAIAALVAEDALSPEYIIPLAIDRRVGPAVAKAVARAARESGVARR